MPINSRAKGAAGEREFAKTLHDELGVTLARNLEQTRDGGHDLVIVDAAHPLAPRLNRYAFEVKRYAITKPALIHQWWQQAVEQAERADKLPALAYRGNREPWRVVVPLCALSRRFPRWPALELTASLDVAGFAALVREGHGER